MCYKYTIIINWPLLYKNTYVETQSKKSKMSNFTIKKISYFNKLIKGQVKNKKIHILIYYIIKYIVLKYVIFIF